MKLEVKSVGRLLAAPVIVDLQTTYWGLGWLRDYWLTRKALSRTKELFPGYKFSEFRDSTILNYGELRKAHELGDHVGMMRYLSPELYHRWRGNSKEFVFHQQLLNFKLKRARTLETAEGAWSQIWVQLIHQLEGGYSTGYYVMERKVQKNERWRFRRLPDIVIT